MIEKPEQPPLRQVFSWTRLLQAFFLFIFASTPALVGTVFYFVYDDQSWSFIYLFISLGIGKLYQHFYTPICIQQRIP